MSDPASLDLLNDIVQPEAVGWLPLAPGWYVIAALLSVVFLTYCWRFWCRWRHDRYRRLALRELKEIRRCGSPENFEQIPTLLKRAALSAWPRQQVAGMSGVEWHAFLDQSASISLFCAGAGRWLDKLSYGAGQRLSLEDSELELVFTAVETWIRKHQVKAK